jgi:hypothetical protein
MARTTRCRTHSEEAELDIPSDRHFEFWAYTVSLSRLLLRSTRFLDGRAAARNFDVRFLGVAYMDIPSAIGRLALLKPTPEEEAALLDKLARPPSPGEQVIVVEANGHRHFMVASGWKSEENDLDRMDAGLGNNPPH